MIEPLLVATVAMLLEAAIGYPGGLYRRIGHPVGWIGRLIGWADRRMNDDRASTRHHRAAGILAMAMVVGVPTALTLGLQIAAFRVLPGAVAALILGLLAATLPAQRSLHDHVRAVADALETDGLAAGRISVAMIVGRDVGALDEAGVSRAAIESLAENFSDGVVAPLFWCAVFGLPGAVCYKAINTADSMIGHHTPRHEAFGWAAARLDDLVNLPASRLAALWIVLAAPLRAGSALSAIRRDAGRHRSPNAGWPEAAMAGALGRRLAGPRRYAGRIVEDAWMGGGWTDCTPSDIRRALSLYRRACAIEAICLILLLGIACGVR